MNIIELIVGYNKLSENDKNTFQKMINAENINSSKREEIVEQFKHIKNEDGLPYLSDDWIKNNILREDD